MGTIDLRVRDLRTGDERTVAFDDVEAARAWLRARPAFTEGIGVATHGLDPAVSMELKDAMRPLDEDELSASHALDAAADAIMVKKELAARAAAVAAAEAHRHRMGEADPHRPLQIRWTYDGGMTVTDSADGRAITDAARDALLAWIAERDEWVRDRGQVVGEANATVWPDAVPPGKERVQQGTFFPVTAPSDASKS